MFVKNDWENSKLKKTRAWVCVWTDWFLWWFSFVVCFICLIDYAWMWNDWIGVKSMVEFLFYRKLRRLAECLSIGLIICCRHWWNTITIYKYERCKNEINWKAYEIRKSIIYTQKKGKKLKSFTKLGLQNLLMFSFSFTFYLNLSLDC